MSPKKIARQKYILSVWDLQLVSCQDEFNTWLNCEKELISRLDESEIDMSCKSDLFDVLDAEAWKMKGLCSWMVIAKLKRK